MYIKRLVMLMAACTLSTAVCAQNVATVNGKPITQKSLDEFVKLLVSQGAADSAQLRDQVKQEMINRQVFVQVAEKSGLEKHPDVQAELELARQGILVRSLMADHLKKHPISDKQIQAEYDKIKKAQEGKLEYKLRHILVPDEKTANELLAKLKHDKSKFAALAKEYSKDPGSAQKSGELDWAASSNYVPTFSQAVEKLKKGETTTKPVQTQFGWHIIRLEDTRPIEVPPLGQIRTRIEEMLRQQILAAFQQELTKKAKIQ